MDLCLASISLVSIQDIPTSILIDHLQLSPPQLQRQQRSYQVKKMKPYFLSHRTGKNIMEYIDFTLVSKSTSGRTSAPPSLSDPLIAKPPVSAF